MRAKMLNIGTICVSDTGALEENYIFRLLSEMQEDHVILACAGTVLDLINLACVSHFSFNL